jgi:hypothetical protein
MGGMIRMRMISYFYFALIFWISAQPLSQRFAKSIAISAIVISVLYFASRAPLYAELDSEIKEYLSAEPNMEPNTTLLALSYAGWGYTQKPGGRLVKVYLPFEHISGYLTTDKPIVDLSNYESSIRVFWTRYRPERDPFRFINPVRRSLLRPSGANLHGYPPQSGGRVDYVLFWGLDEKARQVNPAPPLRDQLAEAYDLIFVSPERGLVQLYRRKDYGAPRTTSGALLETPKP